MSDEHDSWFKTAFGLDVGEAVGKIKEEVSGAVEQATTAVSQAVQSVQSTAAGVAGAVSGAAKKVAAAAGAVDARTAQTSQGGAGATGSFPLRGSVGRGGKNAAGDVRAVQAALGLNQDGQCGPQTIAAIESFQRNMGAAKTDGRVDAGGPTERQLAGGGRRAAIATESQPATTAAPPRVATPPQEEPGIFGGVQGAINDIESSLQGTLQSAQNSAFEAAGVSPETAQLIREGQQAIADFDKGRNQGRAEGSMGLIDMLPPVALAKAAIRVGSADDPMAEAEAIAREKAATAASIGRIATDPIGFATDTGQSLGKEFVQADREGRKAELVGRVVGHGDVIAATVAVGGAAGGLEAGAAGVETGAARGVGGVARGAAAGVEEGGIVVRAAGGADAGAPTIRAPVFEPIPPTEPGLPPGFEPSPAARSVRAPEVPLRSPTSPLAKSVRPPGIEPIPPSEPFPSTELPPQGVPEEPFNPAPSFRPGPEPFDPAPSFERPPDTIPSPPPEPFEPAPSFRPPPDTVPLVEEPIDPTPPTQRSPGK